MESFYSLVKIVANQASGDSLTIGIIVRTHDGFMYKFSKTKKSIARALLPGRGRQVDVIEKQITAKLDETNASPTSFTRLGAQEYFTYLSRYSNGVLSFSPPAVLGGSFNNATLDKLYALFVDGTESTTNDFTQVQFTTFKERIETRLISRVENRVHTKVTFGPGQFHSLFSSFEMDCVGKNGVLIGAKSLFMGQSKQTLASHVQTYMNVILHLSADYDADIKDNKFYLIADEPSDRESPQHKVWQNLQREELLTVIPSTQSGEVADDILNSHAGKFLQQ